MIRISPEVKGYEIDFSANTGALPGGNRYYGSIRVLCKQKRSYQNSSERFNCQRIGWISGDREKKTSIEVSSSGRGKKRGRMIQ